MYTRSLRLTGITYRRFIRHKSHYLSDKWSKEPFEIGYPTETFKSEQKQLFSKLFPESGKSQDEQTTTEFELYDYSRVIERGKLQRPSYTTPQPQKTTGIDLLKLLVGVKDNHNVRTIWNKLEDEERARLENPPMETYQEQLRIWQGYEAVDYLKQNSEEYRYNPYPLSGLYPWEIIKDKLRRGKKEYEFELDYYDALIRESFGRNSTRKAQHIYYTDLKHQHPETEFTWKTVHDSFRDLPPLKQNYYKEKEAKRKEQVLITRSPYNSLNFHNFLEQFNLYNQGARRPLFEATKKWNAMSSIAQLGYRKSDRAYANSRQYKERLLDLKTEIVMDYVYYCGGAQGAPSEFNWLEDMKRRTGGLEYIRGLYWSTIV